MEEIEKMVARHDEQIKVANHRIEDLEKQGESLNSIALSVERLTVTLQNMVETMKNHTTRLEKIERVPADNWKDMRKTIISTVISTLVGGVVGAIIVLL